MSEPGAFPDTLRSSAVPRWSHRDPVECGNPFASDDDRHPVWHGATGHAKDTLVRLDAGLEGGQADHPQPYRVRLVALAVARFDVWARRTWAIVVNPRAVQDYERWLDDYRRHWLDYVAETCPWVDVADDLSAQLTARSRFWIDGARRALGRTAGPVDVP